MSYLKSSLPLLVFLIISVLSSTASAAPLTRIECPHESIAYGATTPTSGGWVHRRHLFNFTN